MQHLTIERLVEHIFKPHCVVASHEEKVFNVIDHSQDEIVEVQNIMQLMQLIPGKGRLAMLVMHEAKHDCPPAFPIYMTRDYLQRLLSWQTHGNRSSFFMSRPKVTTLASGWSFTGLFCDEGVF